MSESATHVPPLKIYRADSGVHPLEALRALYTQRELLLAWTSREIRVRHKQAALGAAWAVLQPLAPMLIFTVIFTNFLRVPTNDVPYPLFSYVALLPWTLFSYAQGRAAQIGKWPRRVSPQGGRSAPFGSVCAVRRFEARAQRERNVKMSAHPRPPLQAGRDVPPPRLHLLR